VGSLSSAAWYIAVRGGHVIWVDTEDCPAGDSDQVETNVSGRHHKLDTHRSGLIPEDPRKRIVSQPDSMSALMEREPICN